MLMVKILKQVHGYFFALACNYISKQQHVDLANKGIEVGKLINYMIHNPGKFGVKEV